MADKWLKRSPDNLLILSLPNMLTLTGIFIIVASQATLYALLLVPGLPIAMAAVGMSMQDPEKATSMIINEHNMRAIEAFNRFKTEPQIMTETIHTWDPTNSKVAIMASLLTVITFYGIMVNNGWVPPIGTLVKKAFFGNSEKVRESIKDSLVESTKMGESAANEVAQKVMEATAKTASVPKIAAFVGDKSQQIATELITNPIGTTAKGLGLMTLLGFSVKHIDKIITVSDLATRAASIYVNNSGYAKTVMRVTGYIFAIWSPLGSIFSTVFAAEDEGAVAEELLKVEEKLKRNINLIGLEYEEVIRRLAEEKEKMLLLLMAPFKDLPRSSAGATGAGAGAKASANDKDAKATKNTIRTLEIPKEEPSSRLAGANAKVAAKASDAKAGTNEMTGEKDKEQTRPEAFDQRRVRTRRMLQLFTILGIILFVLGCILEYEVQQLLVNLESIEKARLILEEADRVQMVPGETPELRRIRDPFYGMLVKAVQWYYS